MKYMMMINILKKIFFFLLDRYYRYGITFEDSDIYHEILFCFGNPFKKNYMYMKI